MPKEICSDVPKMIVTGFDEMILENFKGILEYEEFFVRISTHIGNDDIKVTGKIESIEMERTIE